MVDSDTPVDGHLDLPEGGREIFPLAVMTGWHHCWLWSKVSQTIDARPSGLQSDRVYLCGRVDVDRVRERGWVCLTQVK